MRLPRRKKLFFILGLFLLSCIIAIGLWKVYIDKTRISTLRREGGNRIAILIAEFLATDDATRYGYNDLTGFSDLLYKRFGFHHADIRQILVTNNQANWKDSVLHTIEAMTRQANNVVVIYYSGHGGQVIDPSDDEDVEEDGLDEFLSLGNQQILDDELAATWGLFATHTDLVFITNCCHAGTMQGLTRVAPTALTFESPKTAVFHIAAVPDNLATPCIDGISAFSHKFFKLLSPDMSYQNLCEKIPPKFKHASCNSNVASVEEVRVYSSKIF